MNKLSSLGIEVYNESDLAMLEKVRILVHGIVAGNFGKYDYNPREAAKKEKQLNKVEKQLKKLQKKNKSIKFHFKKLFHLSYQRIFKRK